MQSRIKDERTDFLFECILKLENIEDCYAFFEDLCTVNEVHAMGQRLEVARLLSENVPYNEIADITGASTATISRVAKALNYGAGGYKLVLGEE